MANDITATPEGVIEEFAQFISVPSTCEDLVEYRITEFTTTITSPEQALTLLAAIQVNDENEFPLADTPANYLGKLEDRLELMMDKELNLQENKNEKKYY